MSTSPKYIYEEPTEKLFKVLPDGEYDFTIAEVFDFETSANNNEMLPIVLDVEGQKISEFLVFTDKAKYKIDQLLKSIGKAPAPGTAVDFDDPTWLAGCKGRVKIKIEPFKGRDGQMKDSNKVVAYLFTPGAVQGHKVTAPAPAQRPPSRRSAPQQAPSAQPPLDDNIPY